MNRLDFNQGLRAATNHLIKTAEDIEQILARALPAAHEAKGRQSLGWQAQLRNCESLKAKAELLRGQAHNILDTLTK